MSNKGNPCWIEIPSRDPFKLKEFYTAVFPSWKFRDEEMIMNGQPVLHYSFEEPSGLSGGIVKIEDCWEQGKQPQGTGFTVYYFVDSIEEVEKQVHSLGGGTALGKMPERTHAFFANMHDPDGNRFGIYEVIPEEQREEPKQSEAK